MIITGIRESDKRDGFNYAQHCLTNLIARERFVPGDPNQQGHRTYKTSDGKKELVVVNNGRGTIREIHYVATGDAWDDIRTVEAHFNARGEPTHLIEKSLEESGENIIVYNLYSGFTTKETRDGNFFMPNLLGEAVYEIDGDGRKMKLKSLSFDDLEGVHHSYEFSAERERGDLIVSIKKIVSEPGEATTRHIFTGQAIEEIRDNLRQAMVQFPGFTLTSIKILDIDMAKARSHIK